MIELINASVQFGRFTALDNCNIQVNRGEVVTLLGPNGAGKSTALKALSGDVALSSGYAQMNGADVSSYSDKTLASLRAVMTQSYELMFDFLVKEVVEMASFVHAEAFSNKQLIDFSEQAMTMTDVYELKDKNFNALSGGQKQRVQLARVVNQILPVLDDNRAERPYLFIDEPTSSLDLYHQYEVMRIASKLAERGVGVVAVLHDLALAASFSDRLYLLNKGRVVASGNSDDVLKQQQLFETYGVRAHLQQQDGCYPSIQISSTS